MQLQLNLVRNILLRLECLKDNEMWSDEMAGVSKDEALYHIRLMSQEDLIFGGNVIDRSGGRTFFCPRNNL